MNEPQRTKEVNGEQVAVIFRAHALLKGPLLAAALAVQTFFIAAAFWYTLTPLMIGGIAAWGMVTLIYAAVVEQMAASVFNSRELYKLAINMMQKDGIQVPDLQQISPENNSEDKGTNEAE